MIRKLKIGRAICIILFIFFLLFVITGNVKAAAAEFIGACFASLFIICDNEIEEYKNKENKSSG